MTVQWPGGPSDHSQMMRAAHADRERAADVLKAGFAEGRLTKAEYDQRLTRVHQAKTYGELHSLIADLPQGPVPVPRLPQPAVPRTLQPAAILPPVNSYATGALVCGILSPMTGGATAIPAVILGHKARGEIRRSGERGDGYAVTGLLVGYAFIGAGLLLFLLIVQALVSGG